MAAVPALSPMPRSHRPDFGAGMVGRTDDLAWLLKTDGDKIIAGQPGMGKTYLLQQFARSGNAYFLRSTDENGIASEIASQSPAAILVEDGSLHLDSLRFLLSHRRDQNLTFDVIVDCWPGDVDQLRTVLGLSTSRLLELSELKDCEIVELINGSGIQGPNRLLHQIVHQASGCPGRAVMLVDACLQKTEADWTEVWTGEKLASWVRARFSGVIGDAAVEVWACFSLGGSRGLAVRSVAAI